jgi:hypothetical protein
MRYERSEDFLWRELLEASSAFADWCAGGAYSWQQEDLVASVDLAG